MVRIFVILFAVAGFVLLMNTYTPSVWAHSFVLGGLRIMWGWVAILVFSAVAFKLKAD